VHSAKLSALGEMAGGIAHEINNPLTIILGWANRLKSDAEKNNSTSEMVLNSATKIIDTSERIVKIIKGLKAISHEKDGDDFAEHNIVDIINETLSFCSERFKNNAIALEVVFKIPNDFKVKCQSVQLGQVLLNLLNNAYDVVTSLKTKWVKILVENQNGKLQIRVSDAGPLIEEGTRGKIFQPFFTTKEVGQGTGLGLSISKNIMTQHKGDIYLDEKASSTTFVVELPTN